MYRLIGDGKVDIFEHIVINESDLARYTNVSHLENLT